MTRTRSVSGTCSLWMFIEVSMFTSVLLRSDTGSLKLGRDKFGEDDDDAGSAVMPAAAAPLVPLRPVYDGPMPTPPQKAFQPGSTPAHLTHRFMVGLIDAASSFLFCHFVAVCF